MIKKVLMLFLFLLAVPAGNAAAYEDIIDIRINGEYIFTDTNAVIENGVTLAPVRWIANALGAESVDWNEAEYRAGFAIGDNYITIDINQDTIYLNSDIHSKGVNSGIINDRTYVPVRLISELLGAEVSWDSHYKNVEITLDGHIPPQSSISTTYGDDELLWLGRIIYAESRGEPMEGKIAVGNVILNRVESPTFPNTIYGVIFDRTYSVQFEPTINGAIYNTPCRDSIKAAKHALSGTELVGDCLYFFNPAKASSSWISKNRPYYTTIANHDFYL